MAIEMCPRETEIFVRVSNGSWPHAADSDLRSHAGSCVPCRELILVATAMLSEDAMPEPDSRLPSAGAVWWRMQIRARREAAQKVTRNAAALQIAILLATVSAIVFLTSALFFQDGWRYFAAAPANALTSVYGASPLMTTLIGVLVLGTLIAPVAVYFAGTEE